MPSIFTLSGSTEGKPSLGEKKGSCRCVQNPRTGRGTEVCFIGKGARTPKGKISRSGYIIRGKCSL